LYSFFTPVSLRLQNEGSSVIYLPVSSSGMICLTQCSVVLGKAALTCWHHLAKPKKIRNGKK